MPFVFEPPIVQYRLTFLSISWKLFCLLTIDFDATTL